MAISAKFQADFTSFETAVKRADQQLALFAAGADKVGPSVNRMVDTVAKGVTTRATPALAGMTSSLRSFDNALGAAGVNITPYVRGLSDIEQAAGETASSLGAVATAGLTFGAALAGWNIGRAISQLLDLDKAIGNSTARMLGLGDVWEQRAGAKADVLALATQRAGRAITDFNEALKINQEFVDNRQRIYGSFSRQLELTAVAVSNLTQAQYDEIRSGEALGKSKADIAKQLGLTEAVVAQASKNMRDREKAAEQQHKDTEAAVKKATEAYKKLHAPLSDVTEQFGLSTFALNRFQQIGLVPVIQIGLQVADVLEGWQVPLESATGGIDGLTLSLEEYQRAGMHAVARTIEMNKELMGLPSSAKTAENSIDSVAAAAERGGGRFGDFVDRIRRGLGEVTAEFLNWDNFMNGIMNGIFGPGGIIANLVARGMAMLTDLVIQGLAKLGGWIKDFFGWIGGLFGDPPTGPATPPPGAGQPEPQGPRGPRTDILNPGGDFTLGQTRTRSFAGGTGGRFLDFGSGTLAMLHGRERVMTTGERTTESADITQALADILRELRMLPRHIRDAVLLAA